MRLMALEYIFRYPPTRPAPEVAGYGCEACLRGLDPAMPDYFLKLHETRPLGETCERLHRCIPFDARPSVIRMGTDCGTICSETILKDSEASLMKTFDRIWTALAIVLMVLPFVALGYELVKSEALLTIAVFAVMGVLLFGTFILGMRVKPESPGEAQDAEADAAKAHSSVETRR
ncbi:MAG: hypothetical protein RMJ55_05340 [Roseiflexaceae bacterium]|nr:hypothetical protein [Roseiflexaceae bacterium]